MLVKKLTAMIELNKTNYPHKSRSFIAVQLQPQDLRKSRRISVHKTYIRQPERIQRVTKHVHSTRPERLVSFPTRNKLLNSQTNLAFSIIFLFYPSFLSPRHQPQQLLRHGRGRCAVAYRRVQPQSYNPLSLTRRVYAHVKQVTVTVCV